MRCASLMLAVVTASKRRWLRGRIWSALLRCSANGLLSPGSTARARVTRSRKQSETGSFRNASMPSAPGKERVDHQNPRPDLSEPEAVGTRAAIFDARIRDDDGGFAFESRDRGAARVA